MGRPRVHGWCHCGFHHRPTWRPLPYDAPRAEYAAVARDNATRRIGPGSRLPGPVIQQAITANA